MKSSTNALKILNRIAGQSRKARAAIARERVNLEIAGQIYALRTEAKFSQRDLAAKLGTTQSVVSRLEDADYDGHSLSMLRRVAAVLDKRIEIKFVPVTQRSLRVA